MHDSGDISENGKPEIVLYYNSTKGGVDSMDQMAHSFSCKRKIKRWPMVMFFNIIDLSTIAARVIWQLKFPDDKLSHEDKRHAFNKTIAHQLVLQQIQRRANVATLQTHIRQNISVVLNTILPQNQPQTSQPPRKRQQSCDDDDDAEPNRKRRKQSRCVMCPSKKDRKTSTKCSNKSCQKAICKEHTITLCSYCGKI